MPVGPLELLVLGFSGDDFRGEVAPAIEAAQRTGAIRVVDLLFVHKNADGSIIASEVEESDQSYARNFDTLAVDVRGLLTEEDAMTIAELLPADTTAVAALVEHTWATDIAQSVERAGGSLLVSQRLSPRLLESIGDQIDAILSAPR